VRGLALLWLLPVVTSAGDLPARLSVERAAGAERCDGRAELLRRVQRILRLPHPESAPLSSLAIDVRFERDDDGTFLAHVSASGAKPGQRELRDVGPSCDALSQAVSVAIALLLDNALTEQSAPAVPAAPAAAQVERRADAPTAPAPARARAPLRLRAALEAGGGYGLGGDVALLGSARLGVKLGDWAFELGASGSWPNRSDFAFGSVRTSLLFGSARACYLFGRGLALGPCLQLGIGRLRGAGAGYEQAQTSGLLWTAAGPGLAAEMPLGSRAYLALGASLWLPSRRQSFSVQNAGIAWESRPVAASLAAGVGLWLF
jgi:hypothetical protein